MATACCHLCQPSTISIGLFGSFTSSTAAIIGLVTLRPAFATTCSSLYSGVVILRFGISSNGISTTISFNPCPVKPNSFVSIPSGAFVGLAVGLALAASSTFELTTGSLPIPLFWSANLSSAVLINPGLPSATVSLAGLPKESRTSTVLVLGSGEGNSTSPSHVLPLLIS